MDETLYRMLLKMEAMETLLAKISGNLYRIAVALEKAQKTRDAKTTDESGAMDYDER